MRSAQRAMVCGTEVGRRASRVVPLFITVGLAWMLAVAGADGPPEGGTGVRPSWAVDVSKAYAETLRVSPDCKHIAYVLRGDKNRDQVMRDGKPEGLPVLRQVEGEVEHVYAPGRTAWGDYIREVDLPNDCWHSMVRDSLTWSPDSQHLGFLMSEGWWTPHLTRDYDWQPESWYIVTDGSPQRYIQTTHVERIDGQARQVPDRYLKADEGGYVRHSPLLTYRRGAFAVIPGSSVVYFGERSMIGEIAAPQGARVAAIRQEGRQYLLMVDGQEWGRYSEFRSVVWSPNGEHVAYAARDGRRWVVAVDGAVRATLDEVGANLAVSQDGAVLGYFGRSGKVWTLTPGGKPVEGKPGRVALDPSGVHVAYTAEQGKAVHVIVDGRDVGAADQVLAGPVFDGALLRYVGLTRVGKSLTAVMTEVSY